MSPRLCGVRFLLLACAAALAACTVVDPLGDLGGYTDTCKLREHCTEGFTCSQGHCVTAAGAACREDFDSEPCELTAGVCADAKRACIGGLNERACAVSAYGPTYEALETTCGDGLDNDCDGLAEVRRVAPLAAPGGSLPLQGGAQLVRFGGGYITSWTAYTGGASPSANVYYRVFGAQLQTQGADVPLDAISAVPVQFVGSDGKPYATSSSFYNLQVIPYEGGAIVMWSVYDVQNGRAYRKAVRLEVAPQEASGAVVALPTRELPATEFGPSEPVHAAVAADRSRVLVTWTSGGKLRGQAFDLDLVPSSAAVTLSAPLAGDPFEPSLSTKSPWGVSPNGLSDFALAWGSAPETTERRVVRFRTVTGNLEQFGEVLGTDVTGMLNDLRLLAAQRPEDAPLAAWLDVESAPTAASVTAAATTAGLVVARPFGPGGSPSPTVSLEGVSSLNVARDGNDLLVVHTVQGDNVVLRRISADGSSAVRPLGVRWDLNSATLLTGFVPDMWTLVSMQFSGSQVVSACRF